MKNKNLVILFVLASLMGSCKKAHTCMCSNPYIDSGGVKIKGTKREAKKKCKEMENNGTYNFAVDCKIFD